KYAFNTKKTSIAKVIDQHKASLGMQLVSALGVTVVLGLSTQVALAACTLDVPTQTYTCSGSITTPQTLTGAYNTVDIEASTDIDTTGSGSYALAIEGVSPEITINQAAGSKLKGDDKALSISNISNTISKLNLNLDGDLESNPAVNAADAVFLEVSGNVETTIDFNGNITAGYEGIYIDDQSSGKLTIKGSGDIGDVANPNAITSNAIYIFEVTSNVDIDLSGDLDASRRGINIDNISGGTANIKTSGNITTRDGSGIYVRATAANVGDIIIDSTSNITTDIDTVTPNTGSEAIYVENLGTGRSSITYSGDIEAKSDDGIRIINGVTATDATIRTQGTVSGGSDGISVSNSVNDADVTTTGSVTGNNGDGIIVTNLTTAKNISVEAQGDVTGSENGIIVINSSGNGGETSITTSGKVSGTNEYGISARTTDNGAGKIEIIANDTVEGSKAGIRAISVANIDITAKSTVTATGGEGIFLFSSTSDTAKVTTISGAITGSSTGITVNATNATLDVTAGGAVTGTTAEGILTIASGTTITADGDVTGGTHGINVDAFGNNAVVTTTGSVRGNDGQGIVVSNTSNAKNISVEAQGDVSGSFSGIEVNNNSDNGGETIITTNGKVSGT
ncbi:MAG: beta strand repeat-containing protein, partial [Ostreibacterium sp.]